MNAQQPAAWSATPARPTHPAPHCAACGDQLQRLVVGNIVDYVHGSTCAQAAR